MLTRNCVKRLFEDTDINVPVTIYSNHSKNDFYKSAWFTLIKESLDEKLLTSEQVYTFQITSINGKIYTIHTSGNHIIEELRNLFLYKNPMSLRIDILEDSDSSWIILVKSDL